MTLVLVTRSVIDVLDDAGFDEQGDGQEGDIEEEEIYAIAT